MALFDINDWTLEGEDPLEDIYEAGAEELPFVQPDEESLKKEELITEIVDLFEDSFVESDSESTIEDALSIVEGESIDVEESSQERVRGVGKLVSPLDHELAKKDIIQRLLETDPPVKQVVLEMDSLKHRKARILGNHIYGSIKFGKKIDTQELRIFINMDVSTNYEVIGFRKLSHELQAGALLKCTNEDKSTANTSYLLSSLMNVTNWNKYKGVLPLSLLRDLTFISLTFCLTMYDISIQKELKAEEKRLGLDKDEDFESKISIIPPEKKEQMESTLDPNTSKPEEEKTSTARVHLEEIVTKAASKLNEKDFHRIMDDKLRQILDNNWEKFSRYGDIRETFDKFKKASFYHKAKIFCYYHLFPYLIRNCLSLVFNMNSFHLNQLECLEVRNIVNLNDWRRIVEQVKVEAVLSVPENEIIITLSQLVDRLEKEDERREGAIDQAKRSGRSFDPREFREKRKRIIEEFFKGLGTMKAIGRSGLVYTLNTLPSLINYCQKMTQHQTISNEDRNSLIGIRDRLLNLHEGKDLIPLSYMQQMIKTYWDSLISDRKGDGKESLIELRNKFMESTDFEEAWSYALRFKGLVYEVIFAEDYGLNYVKESTKMTLGAFIHSTYKEKYELFLNRSAKNTYIRDLKPDFILYQKYDLRPLGADKWHQKIFSDIKKDSKKKEEKERTEEESERKDAASEDKPLFTSERKYSIERQKPELGKQLLMQLLDAIEAKKGEFGKTLEPGLAVDEEETSLEKRPNLTIIEVGYQTNSEDKVNLDIDKWRPAKNVLESIGFEFRIVSVADSTKSMKNKSWISREKATKVASVIGTTFALFVNNMPPGLTDISIGSISTQNLRAKISSDHKRKTPVTEYNLMDHIDIWKDEIFKRPSGAVIPVEIQKQFIRNLILGSTMRKSDAERIYKMIVNNKQDIIDRVNASSLKFEIIDENSWKLFLFGCYEEDYKSFSNSNCSFIKLKAETVLSNHKMISRMAPESEIYKQLFTEFEISLIDLEETINRHSTLEEHVCNIKKVKKSWLSGIFNKLLQGANIEHGIKSQPKKSCIDRLCNLTLAGRSGKQKESKSMIIRLLETISRCTKGYLKDSKGLLMAPYRDIMRKSGATTASGDNREEEISKSTGLSLGKSKRRGKKASTYILSPESPARNLVKTCNYRIESIMAKKDTLNPETTNALLRFKSTINLKYKEMALPKEYKNMILSKGAEILKKRQEAKDADLEEQKTLEEFLSFKIEEDIEEKAKKEEEKKLKGEIKSEEEKLSLTEKLKKEAKEHEKRYFETLVLEALNRITEEEKMKLIQDLEDEEKLKEHTKPKPKYTKEGKKIEQIEKVDDFDKDPEVEITCYELLSELGLNSYVEGTEINGSLFELLKDTINTNPTALAFENQQKKLEKFSDETDDRYRICELQQIMDHLMEIRNILKINPDVRSIDEIFNSVVITAVQERVENIETSKKILEDIRYFCKLIMGTNFGSILYIYMKICETFLNFTSEMTYSGIKLMKIKGCDLNLLAKVNKNKNTNCSVIILDSNFKHISQPFFLNRNKATLGQSFLYCMIVNIFQAIQTQGGYSFLNTIDIESALQMIQVRLNSLLRYNMELITDIYTKGQIRSVNSFSEIVRTTGDEYTEIAVNTIGSMIFNYAIYFGFAMLNNSRRISKLTQMVRYPLMLSLSEFGFPKGVGGKMGCSIRSVEDHLYKKMITFICAINVKASDKIISNWAEMDPHNARFVTSLELFPFSCKNPRQMVSDKYICHFYNKEDDDFSEASIRVLNEVCEKIFDWELELKKEVELNESLEQDLLKYEDEKKRDQIKLEIQKCLCRIRCLMGIKDVAVSNREIEPNWVTGELGADRESETRSSSDHSEQSVFSLTSKFSVEEDTTSTVGSAHITEKIHTKSKMSSISMKSIEYQMKKVCDNMYKFTYGVPEICQAFTELARRNYSTFNIVNAFKSKRNNEQISKVTETTSIVSEPNTQFNLETAINNMAMKNAIKLVKIITKSNRSTMANALKYKSFEKEMAKIMLLDDSERQKGLNSLQESIDQLKKKSKMNWQTICEMNINETIMADNCSYLFIFFKSFWRKVRNFMGKDRKWMVNESNKALRSITDCVKYDTEDIMLDEKYIDLIRSLNEVRGKALKKITETFISRQKIDHETLREELRKLSVIFMDIHALFVELETKRKTFPGVSYPELEQKLLILEAELMEKHHRAIFYITLCLIGCESINIFSLTTDTYSALFLKEIKDYILKISQKDLTDPSKTSSKTDKYLVNLLLFMSDSKNTLSEICKDFDLNELFSERLINYCQLLVFNIRRPISMKLTDVSKGITNFTDMMEAMKAVISQSNFDETKFDFSITIVSCVKGSLQMCRKLLDRREAGVKIPRGTRSKVIYEMIKITKKMGTTSVQEIGFQCAMNPKNRFYAGIAPKAQIGGDRDLLVMSTEMKVATHCTESCSKAIMEQCVKNDGLTNKTLKDQILNKAKENMMLKIRTEQKIPESGKRYFVRIININGDSAKWGPIHCTAFFSQTSQQLLSDFPDWSNLYKLIMVKSLIKQLEIPPASLEKIIQSALMSGDFRKKLRGLRHEGSKKQKYQALKDHISSTWTKNDIVKLLVDWFIKDDKAFIDSYNHMGQGIHHATSSLFANICHTIIDEILTQVLLEAFPGCTVTITHAGSSDDFAKTIIIQGMVSETTYKIYDNCFKTVVKNMLNLMTGLMRCCQMMVSEKTTVSPIVAEFYSEFLYLDKVSPSTKKYLSSQIINHSVTSPLTLFQATHVECQQAMYMGVPLSSIIMLALLKQNIFYENSIEIFKQYGEIIFNSVSTLGRLYFPKYSSLTSESAAIEDLESLMEAIDYIIQNRKSIKFENFAFGISDDEMSKEELMSKFNLGGLGTDMPTDIIDSKESLVESTTSSDLIMRRTSSSEEKSEGIQYFDEEDDRRVSIQRKLDHSKLCRSILTLLMYKYYSSSNDYQSDQGYEKVQNWSGSTLIKDPFTQMLPESIRSKIEQIKNIKNEMQNIHEILTDTTNPLKTIAMNLIARNTVTEDYDLEVGRLQQALESANIIWGLSGGIRSISVSVNRQMLRSYHFENRLPIDFKNTWIHKDQSRYISGTGERIEAKNRIRFTDFLDTVKKFKFEHYNFPEEITSVLDIPICVEKIEEGNVLKLDLNKMDDLLDLLNKVVRDLKDSNQLNLEDIEGSSVLDYETIHRPTIRRTRIVKAEKLNLLHNNPAIIASAIINQDALYIARPTNLIYTHIGTDINSLENNFPHIVNMILNIKSQQTKIIQDFQKDKTPSETKLQISKEITAKNINKLITCCRMLMKQKTRYTTVFLLHEKDEETDTSEPNILFSYNTIENLKITTSLSSIHKIQDEITYTLMGVLSCINWYFYNNSDKTDHLEKFLRLNFRLLAERTSNLNCEQATKLQKFKDQLPNSSVESFFYSESRHARVAEKQKTLKILSKLATNSHELVDTSSAYEMNAELDFRGNVDSGMFTFYCDEGSISGYVKNQIIYLMMSRLSSKLLVSLESPILKQFKLRSAEIEPYKTREHFFRLLPKYREYKTKIDGDYALVYLSREAEYIICRKGQVPKSHVGEPRLVYISGSNLVNTYKKAASNQKTIELKWSNKTLYILTSVETKEMLPADSMSKAIQDLSAVLGVGEAEKIRNKIQDPNRSFLIHKIKLSDSASKHSIALFHCLLKHSKEVVVNLSKYPTVGRLPSKYDKDIQMNEEEFNNRFEMQSKPGTEEFFVEKLMPVLEKMKGLDTIYPINFLIDYYGYSYMSIEYDGVSEDSLTNSGHWNINRDQKFNVNRFKTVMDSIERLRDGKITKDTILFVNNCQKFTKKDSDIANFINYYKNSPMDVDLLNMSIFLFSAMIFRNISRYTKQEIIKSGILVKKIAESNPSFVVKLSNYVTIRFDKESKLTYSTSMKKEIDIVKHIMTIELNCLQIDAKSGNVLRTGINRRFSLLKSLFRLVDSPVSSVGSTFIFHFRSSIFTTPEYLLPLLKQCMVTHRDSDDVSVFQDILYLLLKLTISGEAELEKFPDDLKVWITEGKSRFNKAKIEERPHSAENRQALQEIQDLYEFGFEESDSDEETQKEEKKEKPEVDPQEKFLDPDAFSFTYAFDDQEDMFD